jgi:hypothetical protein
MPNSAFLRKVDQKSPPALQVLSLRSQKDVNRSLAALAKLDSLACCAASVGSSRIRRASQNASLIKDIVSDPVDVALEFPSRAAGSQHGFVRPAPRRDRDWLTAIGGGGVPEGKF